MRHLRQQFLLISCLISIATLCSCNDNDLPEVTVLENLRLLALIADKPEVSPLDTVTITPLISDLNGNGRALTFSASACLDPGVAVGALPSCDNAATQVILATNQPVTGLTAPYYTGATTSTFTVTVPDSSVIFATAATDAQFNGVNYLITIVLTAADGATTQGFRRLKVSTKTTKNNNPTYETTPVINNANTLQLDLTDGSKETFDTMTNGVTLSETEIIETSWFVSDGTIKLTITDDENGNVFTPPTTPLTANPILLVIVTRDNRGGVATSQLTL